MENSQKKRRHFSLAPALVLVICTSGYCVYSIFTLAVSPDVNGPSNYLLPIPPNSYPTTADRVDDSSRIWAASATIEKGTKVGNEISTRSKAQGRDDAIYTETADRSKQEPLEVRKEPSSSLPDLPELEIAPAAGGIIFFVHVPKTGGTTIRDNFGNLTKFPNVRYKKAFLKRDFERVVKPAIDKRLREPRHLGGRGGTVLFAEIHGRNTPTLMELAPQLHAWKETAQNQGIPFFTFTLLRDTVDLAVSFFNYFHVFGDPRFPRMNGTIDNLRQSLQYNPQCTYLYKGERAFFRDVINVTKEHCDQVLTTMEDVMDWVGDTKSMTQNTLPLLNHWVTGNAVNHDTGIVKVLESTNVLKTYSPAGRRYLKRAELDPETVDFVRSFTGVDQYLRERALRIQRVTGKGTGATDT